MLELKNITYKIEGKTILKNINLHFEDDKIYALTGQNGSGKSSIAKIIAGIYKPSFGSVFVDGKCIDSLSIDERAKEYISYSFQNPALFKGVTIAQLLDIAMNNPRNNLNKSQLLYQVGLSPMEYLNRTVDGSLSGGELKRVEIATVIARNTKVVIFDEPEAGIDLWSYRQLINTFKKMHNEFKTTYIIISHQERLLSMADEIICLKNGTVDSSYNKDYFMSNLDEDCGLLEQQRYVRG